MKAGVAHLALLATLVMASNAVAEIGSCPYPVPLGADYWEQTETQWKNTNNNVLDAAVESVNGKPAYEYVITKDDHRLLWRNAGEFDWNPTPLAVGAVALAQVNLRGILYTEKASGATFPTLHYRELATGVDIKYTKGDPRSFSVLSNTAAIAVGPDGFLYTNILGTQWNLFSNTIQAKSVTYGRSGSDIFVQGTDNYLYGYFANQWKKLTDNAGTPLLVSGMAPASCHRGSAVPSCVAATNGTLIAAFAGNGTEKGEVHAVYTVPPPSDPKGVLKLVKAGWGEFETNTWGTYVTKDNGVVDFYCDMGLD